MLDFTYNTEEISNNPVWQLAFSISETLNDEAPIGWSKYIGVATVLLSNYDIKRKKLPVGCDHSIQENGFCKCGLVCERNIWMDDSDNDAK